MEILQPLIKRANDLHEEIEFIRTKEIGDINYAIEQARLAIRRLHIQGVSNSPELNELQQSIQLLKKQYQQHVETLRELDIRLAEHAVVLVDTNGQEKSLLLGQIVKALRPNKMSTLQKCLTYVANFWAV